MYIPIGRFPSFFVGFNEYVARYRGASNIWFLLLRSVYCKLLAQEELLGTRVGSGSKRIGTADCDWGPLTQGLLSTRPQS